MLAPTAVTTMLLAVVAGCAAPDALRPSLIAQAGTVPAALATPAKPTIVLVHGAFAGASGWRAVIALLRQDGFKVVAVQAEPPSAAIAMAGNCPADAGLMRPASAGDMADVNGDGYVCTRQFRSMDGDTLRVTVDNDVPTADSARVELPYVFNG